MPEPISVPTLVSADDVQTRVTEIARQISAEATGQPLVVLGMLGGGWMLFGDLVRQLTVPVRTAFLSTGEYGERGSGDVRILLDSAVPLADRHVIIVDGVIISGAILLYLVPWLKARRAASVRTCAVGVKPHLFKPGVAVEYPCFTFTDEHVVGYGIGHQEGQAQRPFLTDARTTT